MASRPSSSFGAPIPPCSVVICTAYSDYTWDKMTSRLPGSDSFVILKKPFDNIEVLQLAHALTRKWEVTKQAQVRTETLEAMCAERTRALQESMEKLRRSEEQFALVFRTSPVAQAIQHFDDGRFVDVNDGFAQMTGFERTEMIGRTPLELKLLLDVDESDSGSVRQAEAHISHRSGDLRPALVSQERLMIEGEPHLLTMAQDVSERQRLEAQLRQAQKMEAIGQLAAGIAHDFNNLLTIIQGHSSLQLAQPELPAPVAGSLRQIEDAARRAAELTRQLLAFSRRQVMQPRGLDLPTLLRRQGAILHRLLGENIRVSYELPENLPPVFADPTSLEQVVMNLAVNSRDAMPRGGEITVSAQEVRIDGEYLESNPEAAAGGFVRLSVRDNGTGMDAETRRRVFEPFFTTKDLHKGTGMGLATVYGIAKQHGGWAEVESEPGAGALFHVYLPIADRAAEATPAEPQLNGRPTRAWTILVVEDDPSVRNLVVEVLKHHGYDILEAEDAEAALRVWHEHRDQIELVLTDIVMPGTMNGLDLGRRLGQQAPDLKVIYTSGYSADIFTTETHLQEGENYLPKPYLFSRLTSIIYQALEGKESAVSAGE